MPRTGKMEKRKSPEVKSEQDSDTKSVIQKKRVTQACDQCRYHKSKCDGAKLCAACIRYKRVCIYNLSFSKSEGSATRTRLLEDRLAKARAYIDEVQQQLPQLKDGDVDTVLESQSNPKLIDLNPSDEESLPMSTGSAFVRSIVTLLQGKHEGGTLVIKDLIDAPDPSEIDVGPCLFQLPSFELVLELVSVAFSEVFALNNIIPESTFHASMQRLYNINSICYTDEDRQFSRLFSVVLALGLLFHTPLHITMGTEKARIESLRYYKTSCPGMNSSDSNQTMTQLRTDLCMAIYLCTSSRTKLAYKSLVRIRSAPVTVALYERVAKQTLGQQDSGATNDRNLVWTITYFDQHLSAFQDQPPIKPPGPELATIHAINSAASNVGNRRRSDRSFLLSVAIAMQIELLKIMQRMTPLSDPIKANSVDPNATTLLQDELETWQAMFVGIFPPGEANIQVLTARRELEMYFYMAQIMFSFHSLPYHAEPTDMQSLSVIDHIQRGIDCVSAAQSAISLTAKHIDQTGATTISWTNAYIIFLSVVCLLIASTTATGRERSSLQHGIAAGFQLITQTTFGSSHSQQYYQEYIHTLATKAGIPMGSNGFSVSSNHVSEYNPSPSITNSVISEEAMLQWRSSTSCDPEFRGGVHLIDHTRKT